jgi:hypothetical protein
MLGGSLSANSVSGHPWGTCQRWDHLGGDAVQLVGRGSTQPLGEV